MSFHTRLTTLRVRSGIMVLRPGKLAALFPSVAVTWHPTKNKRRAPGDTAATSVLNAWWRCHTGHEWREPVADRVRLDQWKNGDVAACHECAGDWRNTVFRCGHQLILPSYHARPEHRCPDCAQEAWLQLRAPYMRMDNDSTAFKVSGLQAKLLLAKLAAQASAALPPLLYREWQSKWWRRGEEALVGVEQGDCRSFSWFMQRASEQIADTSATLSTVSDESRSVAHVGVTDKEFWIAGIRYIAGMDSPAPVDGSTTAAKLGQRLRAQAQVAAKAVSQGDVTAGTAALTEAIVRWACARGRGERRWKCHREVFVPVIREGGTLSGIVDLVVERPGVPDLVIEIDSANKTWSAEKLRFVHQAGGVPIWVRWHRGPVRAIAGVHVIDLTAHHLVR